MDFFSDQLASNLAASAKSPASPSAEACLASAFAELTRLGGSGSADVPVIGMRPNQWTPFLNVTHDDFTGFDIAGLNSYGEPNQKYVYDDATITLQRRRLADLAALPRRDDHRPQGGEGNCEGAALLLAQRDLLATALD